MSGSVGLASGANGSKDTPDKGETRPTSTGSPETAQETHDQGLQRPSRRLRAKRKAVSQTRPGETETGSRKKRASGASTTSKSAMNSCAGKNEQSAGTTEPLSSAARKAEDRSSPDGPRRPRNRAAKKRFRKRQRPFSSKIKFSPEEDALLQSLLETDKTWTDIATCVNNKLGGHRNWKAVRDRASRLDPSKPKVPLTKHFSYSDEQDDFLRAQLKQAKSLKEIATGMNDKFGTNRTAGALDGRRRVLGIPFERRCKDKYKRWTKEEEDLLIEVWQQYQTTNERISNFERLSGTSRTLVGVRQRASDLGLTPARAARWTREESAFLMKMKSDGHSWDRIVAKFHRRFGTDRSEAALRSRYDKSGQ